MSTLSPVKRLWRLLKLYKPEIRQIYTYAVFIGVVNLSLPLGIQAIINFLQTGQLSSSWFILVTVVLMGIGVAGVLQVLQLRIVENIQQDIFARSAFEFAFRFPKMKAKEVDSIHAPELANRFFDTLTIQKGLPKILIDLSLSTFQIFFGLLLLSVYSLYFIWMGLVMILILYLLVKITGKIGLDTSIEESKYKYRLAHWLEEIGRARRTFQLNDPTSFHLRKTDDITADYVNSRESHFKVLLDQFKSFVGFKIIIAAGILVVGGLLVFNQQMNIGQFVAAEIVIILIINSVEKLLRVWDNVYDVLTAFDKIGFVTDLELQENKGQEVLAADVECSLSLKKATFRHKGAADPTFSELDLTIPERARAVLNSGTGSGKSTLLQVFAGVQELESGDVLLNDISYSVLSRKSLHQKLGIVFAANQIFEATIRENILVGRQVPEKELSEMLRDLGLEDYIKGLPKGLETIMDSGGRRTPRCIIQKIHLARAICHRPGLLLMEDPLVNMPTAERVQLIDYLTDEKQPWTLVVISDDEEWLKKSTMTVKL
ncbi:peptidase domain-containing ABC transporter [Echinicola vietnamensis]|uniref:ABC-type bacteriocin/lantibiotic exporter with N-terminal double-glycine peptidase domain n=1 Tax=Echinicola vietnamensis (strain DSM 17526 / LMG 23754 / KMM 6221) TaxID=926556 RepID=L0G5Z6_ECHVK|nr:ABC transporter ATP-binding protein [Echinicola vietnamensis]AGA80421.1 ABC-type bacteriocin/lantibiotic exporter with N-terminal double-glycine peptidase domain [Echinicola vietnamensis DSM 17526]